MTVMEAYQRWNDAIAQFFFNGDRAGQPVFLSVDETVLRRIAVDWKLTRDPLDDFIASMRELTPGAGEFFRGMAQYGERFAKNPMSGPPMFIGGLALSVLAASRMGADIENGVAQHNYYWHLNELLGLPPQGQPSYFDSIPRLWELLAHWLEAVLQGEYGLPTARQVGHNRYIGWPISQALVRRADVADLRMLAELAGVSINQEISGTSLLSALQYWLRGDGAFTRLAMLLGPQPDAELLVHVADQLAYIVTELGEPDDDVSPHSRQLAHLFIRMVNFSPESVVAQLAWRCPAEEDTEPEAILADGTLVETTTHGDWQGIPASPDWFASGVTVNVLGRKIQAKPATPLVFRKAHDYGRPGWRVQSQEVNLNEPVWIIGSPDQLAEVQHTLGQCGQMGPIRGGLSWLPQGWFLITDAIFERAPDGILQHYQPRYLRSWALLGGVRIRRHTYLSGCLPTLAAPDEVRFQIVSSNGSRLYELHGGSDLNDVDLGEGAYVIRGDGIRRGRLVVSTPPWPPMAPTQPRVVDLPATAARPAARIQGALVEVDGPLQEPIFLPSGTFTILGQRIGEVEEMHGGGNVGVAEWQHHFQPVWRVRIKGHKVAEVLPLQRPPTLPEAVIGGDSLQQCEWARVILAARNRTGRLNRADQIVFRKYVAAAAQQLGMSL